MLNECKTTLVTGGTVLLAVRLQNTFCRIISLIISLFIPIMTNSFICINKYKKYKAKLRFLLSM